MPRQHWPAPPTRWGRRGRVDGHRTDRARVVMVSMRERARARVRRCVDASTSTVRAARIGRTCGRGRSDMWSWSVGHTLGRPRRLARDVPTARGVASGAREASQGAGSGGMCVALDVRRVGCASRARALGTSWSCERECEGWGAAMDTKVRRVLVVLFYIARRLRRCRLRVTGRRRRRRWRHARGRLCRCA